MAYVSAGVITLPIGSTTSELFVAPAQHSTICGNTLEAVINVPRSNDGHCLCTSIRKVSTETTHTRTIDRALHTSHYHGQTFLYTKIVMLPNTRKQSIVRNEYAGHTSQTSMPRRQHIATHTMHTSAQRPNGMRAHTHRLSAPTMSPLRPSSVRSCFSTVVKKTKKRREPDSKKKPRT